MSKIFIEIKENQFLFSCIHNCVDTVNFNTIHMNDNTRYQFSESYLLSNIQLVSDFLQKIAQNYDITKAILMDFEIAVTALKLINHIEKIKQIIFLNDEMLTYVICSQLLENHNLHYIECYSLPEIMYYRFPEGVIHTRCELLFVSKFMNDNKIETYSDLCNKNKIGIFSCLTSEDFHDLDYFLQVNKCLKMIEIFSYKFDDLQMILDFIQKYQLNKVAIYIYEDSSNTKMILNDINLFQSLSKKYHVSIHIKYSKEYKEKNIIKQLNIILLRWTVLGIVFLSSIMLAISYFQERNSLKHYQQNQDLIQEITHVDEVQVVDFDADNIKEKHFENPYQKTYEKQMLQLLEMNPDTVGWLTVKNTNIDYPVVQTTDNDFYLNYAFDRIKNYAGWIFVDYRNKLDKTDKNIIIYGHRVRNTDLIFTTLKNVLEEDWYQNPDNLDITFNMKDELITWRIFSIYTIEKTNDYIRTDFADDEDFLEFVTMLKDRSIIPLEETVNEKDQILTLSTCYSDGKHRLVVHAKRVKSF